MYLKRVFQLGALFWASTITSSLIDNELGYLSDFSTLLFAALLIIAIPVSALLGIKKHGLLSLYWPLPPALCVVFLYNFHWIGVQVSEGRFQWQLPEYAAAVDTIKADNIKPLMAQPDIDGALVGGASLDPVSFASIVNF